MTSIPFHRPFLTGNEMQYVAEASRSTTLGGDGIFSKRCQQWFEERNGCPRVLLTNSCTSALEMSMLLMDLAPGDEVIMASFNFVSAANAVVLRGGIPVFVDIRSDTLNINEQSVADAISNRTRAILVMHYGGIACAMDELLQIAHAHNLLLIEDAAHAIRSNYNGKPLGCMGQFGCLSFHETKNITSGQGGALFINDSSFISRAEVLRDKGTNRSQFLRGEVNRYTWQDIGSAYAMAEMTSAFLYAQLQEVDSIIDERLRLWSAYHKLLHPLENAGLLQRPSVPVDCKHNAHIYWVRLNQKINRDKVLSLCREQGVTALSHFMPLHLSDAGRKFGRTHGTLETTKLTADQLVRLPLWSGITDEQINRVVDTLSSVITSLN